jgi:hypothetical protein
VIDHSNAPGLLDHEQARVARRAAQVNRSVESARDPGEVDAARRSVRRGSARESGARKQDERDQRRAREELARPR